MRIPTALPFIFTGLKVATVLAMIGAIVGDYFGGSTDALGVQIENSISLFDFPLGWAAIVVASAFGIAFYAAVSARRAVCAARDAHRHDSDDASESLIAADGPRRRRANETEALGDA